MGRRENAVPINFRRENSRRRGVANDDVHVFHSEDIDWNFPENEEKKVRAKVK